MYESFRNMLSCLRSFMMSVTSVDLFLLDTLLDNFAFYKMDWFSLFVETDRCMTAASWNYIGCTCLQSLISSLYDISMLILPCTPLLFFFSSFGVIQKQ